MAGKRHPFRVRIIWGLIFSVTFLGWGEVLLSQEDDASFQNRSETRSVQDPTSATEQNGNFTRKNPTSRLIEEEDVPRRPSDSPVLEIQKLTPELEKVLDSWEEKTSQIKKLKGNFVRTSYNHVFAVQKLAKGEFMYEAPDKGYYMFQGYKPSNPRLKEAKDGTPYKFEPDMDEKWYCTGSEIYRMDVRERTYEKGEIPEESRGKNIIDGPLPFLFGMKKEQAVRRYTLKLIKHSPREIWIGVKPKLQQDIQNYSDAKIILNAETYLPIAVQSFDPPGTTETVHLFENVSTNIFKWPLRDPFRPNLIGYKPAVKQETALEDPETVRRPENRLQAPRGSSRTRTAQQRDSGM